MIDSTMSANSVTTHYSSTISSSLTLVPFLMKAAFIFALTSSTQQRQLHSHVAGIADKVSDLWPTEGHFSVARSEEPTQQVI